MSVTLEVRMIPGISSLVYFCAKLHVPWEKVKAISVHGREEGLVSGVREHPMGFALAGSPYMGIGRNLAYRKELFYQQKGFSAHLNLQRGDDDLFINHVATPENTRVETDANAIVRMQPLLRAKDWKEEKIGYASTARLYHGMQRWLAGFETLTRLVFHASWIAAMVIGILHFHWLAAGVACLLFLFRFTLQAVIVNKTARDLEEQRRYYFTLPAFDLLQPIQSLRWKWYCLFRKKSDFLRK